MEDEKEKQGDIRFWLNEEVDGIGYQAQSLIKEMTKAEDRFESIVVFHENFEMWYADRCLSDYDRDFGIVTDTYKKVIDFIEESPFKVTYLRILRSEARYKLGSLYTARGEYDMALPLLEKALKEMEKHRLIPIMRYEYADTCIKEGKCRIEKRDGEKKIRECYEKAGRAVYEKEISTADDYFRTIECLTRNKADKWRRLEADLELSWAVFSLDLYDRQIGGRERNLKAARLHLKKLHGLLFQEADKNEDRDICFYQKKRKDWDRRIMEGERRKTEKGSEKEAHQEVWNAKRDRKQFLAYLATMGACYMRMAAHEGETEPVEWYIRSMECYLAAYYCDLSNTIAMDNIAYISYLNIKEGSREKEFWSRLKRDGNLTGISDTFAERMREDIVEKLRLKSEISLIEQCCERVREMLGEAGESYGWDNMEELFACTRCHSFKIMVRNSPLVAGAVEMTTKRLEEELEEQLKISGMDIRTLRIVLSLLGFELQRLPGLFGDYIKMVWKKNPYMNGEAGRKPGSGFGKEPLEWVKAGVEKELSSEGKNELLAGMISAMAQELLIEERFGDRIEEEKRLRFRQLEEQIKDSPERGEESGREYSFKMKDDILDILENYSGMEATISMKTDGLVLRENKVSWKQQYLYRVVLNILTEVLRIENSNMYALNLKTSILKEMRDLKENREKENGVEDSYQVYTTLRQSTLKKCFINLDNKAQCTENTLFLRERLKRSIILLYNSVSAFMNSFIKKVSEDKEFKLGHYTRLATLPLLVNPKEEALFRLYNMEHLNDPEEGKIFIGLLKEQLDRGEMEAGPGKELISGIIGKYESDSFEKNNVYIGSFTARVDNLNMWFQYGNEGKGCCMVINAEQTFDEDVNITLSHMYQSDAEEHFESLDSRYALYEVAYYPWKMEETAGEDASKEKVDRFVRDTVEKIARIGEDAGLLKREAGLNAAGNHELTLEIQSVIMLILDQVRFLIKSKHYEDEKEYRVIKYSNNPKCDKKGREVPRLYINMKKPLIYSQICLGPKVGNPASVAAYVLNIRKKGISRGRKIEVIKSSIKIR